MPDQTGHIRRLRPLLAVLAAAVLVVGVVGPARAQTEPAGSGSSDLTVVPVELRVDGLPVDASTSVGTLVAEATNTTDPVARLALQGLAAAGDLAPSLDYSTADGNQQGSESLAVGAAGLTAAVDLVDFALESGADSAAARLAALGGSVSTPIGLDASVDAQSVGVSATPSAAGSSVTLGISGLDLGLGDLLPAEVLEALPLGALLDLVGTLGIPLSTDLSGAIASIDDLQRTLEAAVATAGDLADAEELLADAIANDPTLASLQQAVDDAQASVTSLETQIADLEADKALLDPVTQLTQINQINTQLATLNTQLTQAEQDLADAQSDLDAALADPSTLDPTIAQLVAQVDDLTALLEDLLAQIETLLGGLPDLTQLRLDLLDALTGSSLLGVGNLTLDLSTVADADGGVGTATCGAEGLTVLGTAVPAPSCDDIGAALSGLGQTIADALAVLPVSAPVPAVTVAGPTTTASGTTPPDADGLSQATAGVTALSLGISPVDLTATIDDLIAELDALVGQIDALLADLDLSTDSVTGTVDDTGLVPLTSDVAVPATLGDALDELRAVLETLPLGDALEGLSTLGVGANAGTVVLSSSFSATGAGAPGSPQDPNLPRTGSSDHFMLMAALAAIMAGLVYRGLGRTLEPSRVGTRHHR